MLGVQGPETATGWLEAELQKASGPFFGLIARIYYVRREEGMAKNPTPGVGSVCRRPDKVHIQVFGGQDSSTSFLGRFLLPSTPYAVIWELCLRHGLRMWCCSACTYCLLLPDPQDHSAELSVNVVSCFTGKAAMDWEPLGSSQLGSGRSQGSVLMLLPTPASLGHK